MRSLIGTAPETNNASWPQLFAGNQSPHLQLQSRRRSRMVAFGWIPTRLSPERRKVQASQINALGWRARFRKERREKQWSSYSRRGRKGFLGEAIRRRRELLGMKLLDIQPVNAAATRCPSIEGNATHGTVDFDPRMEESQTNKQKKKLHQAESSIRHDR